MIKAITRIVHGNLEGHENFPVRLKESTGTYPMVGIRALAVIGRTVPPSDAPAAYRPRARPLRFRNHCERMAMTGPENTPAATCTKRSVIFEDDPIENLPQ